MKKLPIFMSLLLLSGLILSACQPATPTITPTGTQDVVTGHEATVESVEVLILESFPVQAQAVVKGYLPDGCVNLVDISAERQGNTFTLTLTTSRPAGEVECTEALVPFEETGSLDVYGLDAGGYEVIAQEQSTSFTLQTDNIPQSEQSDTAEGSDAMVEALSLDVMATSVPVQVNATVSGNLRNGCVEIVDVRATREAEAFSIRVVTEQPSGDVACTQALVPFEQTIALDVAGLSAGEYTVAVGDLTETFTLEIDNPVADEAATCPEPEIGQVRVQALDRDLEMGFCFLAPEGFSQADVVEPQSWQVLGPNYAEETSTDIQADLTVLAYALEDSSFEDFVASQKQALNIPDSVVQMPGEIGSQPAVIIDATPVNYTSKIVWVAFGNEAFELIFSPMEPSLFPLATEDMDALYQMVMETWVFLGGPTQ
ncbi:hypothetical protein KQH62_00390 [bacterium]|nr:hypothetical protein [bacterium]